MARRFYYGLEDDDEVGGLGFDELGKVDSDPIDDAGEDSETRDVSDPSQKDTAHNEAASAGGIVVGDNADQLMVDPVGATEALIRRTIGLSVEDLEEVADQLEAAPDPVVETDAAEEDEVANLTTVNVVAPAGATTEVDESQPIDYTPDTAAAVAAVEFLYRIQSREDDTTDSDVEFDVKTPSNDVNIALDDKAVTIEPNSDDMGGDDSGDMGGEEPPAEDTGNDDESQGEDNGGEGTGEEPGEEGGEEPPAEEGSEWWNFM